jgi:hypothetical protein
MVSIQFRSSAMVRICVWLGLWLDLGLGVMFTVRIRS